LPRKVVYLILLVAADGQPARLSAVRQRIVALQFTQQARVRLAPA
jgi:hypothetical protein